MLLRCVLLFAFLSCVRTSEDLHRDGFRDLDSDFNRRFSLWPSVHNAATLLRIRRQVMNSPAVEGDAVKTPALEGQLAPSNIQGQLVANEGAGDAKQPTELRKDSPSTVQAPQTDSTNASRENLPGLADVSKTNNTSDLSNEKHKETAEKSPLPSDTVSPPTVQLKGNGTTAEKTSKEWDLSDPAAMKRGLIVFGGFGLLAMAYFIFYRTKSKFNENSNTNGTSESNQFRYGVLQSDDRRDNLELSRVPLTMESDDDEDEDLEIFDLEEKKKSLSYVNLQANDEDIVLSPRSTIERDDLLLDIEDNNSDILINWSNNGNKSIL